MILSPSNLLTAGAMQSGGECSPAAPNPHVLICDVIRLSQHMAPLLHSPVLNIHPALGIRLDV